MRTFVCAAILALSCAPSFAQYTPKVEVFGGFSYLSYEAASVNLPNGSVTQNCPSVSGSVSICQVAPTPLPTENFTARMNLYGWNASVTADLTPWFGFTTDFGANYGDETDSITTLLTTTLSP